MGDISALRTALERVLYTPGLLSCITANAARRILSYQLRPLLALHQSLYEAAIGQPGALRVVPQGPATAEAAVPPKRILVVGAALGSLAVIRSPLIRAFQAEGFEVLTVASDRDAHAEGDLRSMGIRFTHLPMARTGIAPVTDVLYCWRLTKLMEREQISTILAYTHKPVIYTALAKYFMRGMRRPRCFSLITGLGYVFTDDEWNPWGKKQVEQMLSWLYRVSTQHISGIIFQNQDDFELFRARSLMPVSLPALVVRGSGVDLERYKPYVVPLGPVNFVFIARLLSYKGIREFAAAAALAKKKHPSAVFSVVGPFDPNPSGITPSEMSNWQERGVLIYEGATDDVRPFLKRCSVYVLPSYYREGTPRTVLEAMSTGRAIITADTPGCRETIFELGPPDELGVRRGLNGFLVPARSVPALASAMRAFVDEPGLAAKMGAESRRLAMEYYDVRIINRQMMEFMGISIK